MKPVDLSGVPLVDGHCHPLLRDPAAMDGDTFLDLLSEGRAGTMRAHVVHTGYARRTLRALSGRLDVAPTVDAVLAALGRRPAGADRRRFEEAQIAALLVDTGYPPEAMPLAEMRARLGCAVHEIVRVESAAERLLALRLPYEGFLEELTRSLRAAAGDCVAFKTIVAYRSGLAIREWSADESRAAYARELAAMPRAGRPRLTEKALLDRLVTLTLEIARETGRPLQVHAGFGDPDIDLPLANPLLLRPVLEDPRWKTVSLVLLHMAYPYAREAAFMTAVWPQVYLDLSLVPPFLGAGAAPPLVEILALAPSSKLLYGSDVSGLPELFVLAAGWGRAALGEALAWLAERDGAPPEETDAVARQILSGNARALYGLREP